MKTSITQITAGQQKQYKRFVEDAGDKDGLQKLIENGDEFQSRIVTAIRELSVSNQFADEEVNSSYTYPNGYKVKGIAEQVATLRQLFPELKDATFDESIASRPLPPNAEGWLAIPRWEKLGSSYGEAVDKVLATIKSKRTLRTFYNYIEGETGPEYLRQHAKTVKAFQKLGDEQKGHDILIVPCQFGLRHRGRSVRRAREVMNAVEFGLGAFAVGCMILTHPEREVKWEQLHVDCAGDEFSQGADGDFSSAPFFDFYDGMVMFDAYWFDRAHGYYGSASAFLSQ